MPQALVTRSPGSRRIRSSPLRNAFGGQVIGSTARLRRADVGQRVPGEELQVRVALVDPEGQAVPLLGSRSSTRASPSSSALEVGEGVVERRRADRPSAGGSRTRSPRPASSRPGARARRSPQHGAGGQLGGERSRRSACRAVTYGCCPLPYGQALRPDVRRRRSHAEPALRERRTRSASDSENG